LFCFILFQQSASLPNSSPSWAIGSDPVTGKLKQYSVGVKKTENNPYFHQITFHVPFVANHKPHFEAQLGFDFSTASMALLLQVRERTRESERERAKLVPIMSERKFFACKVHNFFLV
jgi:hypothetical protein